MAIIIKDTKSIEVSPNTRVNYDVTATHYNSQSGEETITEDKSINVTLTPKRFTLSITTIPSSATIEFKTDAEDAIITENTINVLEGTQVTYIVTNEDYEAQQGTVIVTESETIDVTLERLKTKYSLVIHPNPSNAIVTLKADGYKQINNMIVVPEGTPVSYSVAKRYYDTQSGTITITKNEYLEIDLQHTRYQLKVTTVPTSAEVTFTVHSDSSGEDGSESTLIDSKTIEANANTVITYTVTCDSLQTYSETITLSQNIEKTITLKYPSGTVLFDSSTPGTYNLSLLTPTEVTMIIVGGGGGSSSSKSKLI